MIGNTLIQNEKKHIIRWIKEYFIENGPNSKAVIGISGGKDSTICAALCAEALGPENVIGVLMPQGEQADIEDARRIVKHLGIKSLEINIGTICETFDQVFMTDTGFTPIKAVTINTPPRIRMTVLYAVAAQFGGRVCNTCNYSENYVGYSTKFGDHAGDFSPLGNYTVKEVLEIGKILDIPKELVTKTPSDGLCGATDEDNLGFTYQELDNYLLYNKTPCYASYKKICERHKVNLHKINPMPCCKKAFI